MGDDCRKVRHSFPRVMSLCWLQAYIQLSARTCRYTGPHSRVCTHTHSHAAFAWPHLQVNLGVFNALYSVIGFPLGLTTMLVCGAELFTSMTAYTAAAWWEGKVCCGTGNGAL